MKVKIKSFSDIKVIPTKAYDKDFCYDLVAVSEEQIAPNVWKYGLGWGMQIERDELPIELGKMMLYNVETEKSERFIFSMAKDISKSKVNLSIDIRPRSSVWKTGMVLSNCEGTVDEGYTNEISAVFYHVLPNMPRYKVGDKVVQAKIGFTYPIEFEEVEEFEETERGLRGYGSSGK